MKERDIITKSPRAFDEIYMSATFTSASKGCILSTDSQSPWTEYTSILKTENFRILLQKAQEPLTKFICRQTGLRLKPQSLEVFAVAKTVTFTTGSKSCMYTNLCSLVNI